LIIVAPLVFPIAIETGHRPDPDLGSQSWCVNMEIGNDLPRRGWPKPSFVTQAWRDMPMMNVVKPRLPFTAVLFVFLLMVNLYSGHFELGCRH